MEFSRKKMDIMKSNHEINEVELMYVPNKEILLKGKISDSRTAFNELCKTFNKSTIGCQEEFIVLLLNRANLPIGVYKASRGGIDSTHVDVKLILATALKALASGIIVSHNHPSGMTKPSESDIGITKKIYKACKLLDITLLDHIIITPFGDYMSFADEGLLSF